LFCIGLTGGLISGYNGGGTMNELQSQPGNASKRVADVDRKRILVIDDDLPLRGMLAAALRQAGFQVLLAGDGAEGHRALTIHRPDVIVLDLAMPNVNGWDFLQKLKETGYLGALPIIVLSAHLHVEPQAILQMGVSAILPKPFNLPELIDLVEHLAP
jgi:DNA-binding response OmpR family regulator